MAAARGKGKGRASAPQPPRTVWRPQGATALADLVPAVVDPVLQKKAGYTTALLAAWDDIVGAELAGMTMPLKVSWPAGAATGSFAPAVLTVACTPAAAFRIQHDGDVLVSRVNGFLGYGAIGRLRIVQKALVPPRPARPAREPLPQAVSAVRETLGGIADDGLRDALARLGAQVKSAKR